jgi:hypothetical protein
MYSIRRIITILQQQKRYIENKEKETTRKMAQGSQAQKY